MTPSSNSSTGMPIGNANGPAPPIREIGSILNEPGYLTEWTNLQSTDDLETNEKLIFPESINTYHNMLTDPQVQGLRTGTTWPIYRMGWYIQPNGAQPAIVDKISADLNLPVGDTWEDANSSQFNQRRTQNRFKFLDHLENALDAIVYGFQVFEQNGYIGPDGLFHYKKLAPRPIQTISDIRLADDGGIIFIKQFFTDAKEIPIDRLVVYSFGKRGANWHGRSMLRGCYAPWLLKDRALRVGVMNIQRAGVGTPIVAGPPGASEPELTRLDELAARMSAGDKTGASVPYGSIVRLVGVEGSQPDSVGFVKLMNEEMARSFFQMFMQLGQTTSGSRALGQTFVQYHKLVIEYVASWYCTIFNEHVIEDDIEWNYGPDEEYAPLLAWAWDDQGSDQNPQGPAAAEQPTSQYDKLNQAGMLELPEVIREAIPRSSHPRGGPRREKRRPTRAASAHEPPAAASNGSQNGN